jgi:hypothetical protein
MNFLDLARAVKREAGLSGSAPSSAATTVLSEQRLFNWVNWAARDITLAREDWRWRRGMATVAATTSQANAYTAFGLTDFASWKGENHTYKPTAYRVADAISSERKLAWMTYDNFRMTFLTGSQTPGVVQYWSISPTDEFLLGPAPDSAHFVRADYVKDYADLVADADIPLLPTRFHMIIVWRALMEYGGFDAAGEVFQRAEKNYNEMWTALVQSQLEPLTIQARSLGR